MALRKQFAIAEPVVAVKELAEVVAAAVIVVAVVVVIVNWSLPANDPWSDYPQKVMWPHFLVLSVWKMR